ncbi:MAG: LPP20 family lipoprotein [Treponema sp.]|nr:LPP20 family lipoprotein [Treponema sp.]
MNKLFLLVLICLFFVLSTLTAQTGAPAWVNDLGSYDNTGFLAITGIGSDRVSAERNALAALAGFFEQSIETELVRLSETQRIIRNDAAEWTERTNTHGFIRTSTNIDTLIGAEIREVWYDSANNDYYALAVMDKRRSAQSYREIILENIQIINILTNISASEKNSLEGVIRFRIAGRTAQINSIYARIIRLLDGVPPDLIRNAAYYTNEALEIIKTIPIGIEVTNDRQGRINGVFSRAVSAQGFIIRRSNYRYVLRANITLVTVTNEYPGNPNEWVRMSIEANLIDTVSNTVLVSYNISERRSGHRTLAGAENAAYTNAERIINNGLQERNIQIPAFSEHLNNYLSSLLER